MVSVIFRGNTWHQPGFPVPRYGVYAPVYCRSGVAAFGRDPESSRQVWDSHAGYPGDPYYREFYRDIGFDLPLITWPHLPGAISAVIRG